MAVRVGFVGLGQMGAAMAGRLVEDEGVELTVFDVRPEVVEDFVAKGANGASSVAEAAADVDVLSVMVVDDAQVRDVVEQVLAAPVPGLLVAVHSTISPATAEELVVTLQAAGMDLVDAPVSGGSMGAATGRLVAMVGGSDEAAARCREAFDPWAGLVAHVGPVGVGTRCKLARNLLHFCAFAAAGEAARLAEAAGVDPSVLGDIVRKTDAITGGPGAILIRPTAGEMDDADPLKPYLAHAQVLGIKDLELAIAAGDELGVPTLMADRALGLLGAALGVEAPPTEG
jgi:3-hydroxyisobutyrate dehydrogenase-like beta-hydroxyacid dehydrogenase